MPEYDSLYTLCDLELCFWLSKFVHEIKKKDDSEYPPNTLYQICAGLQRALRENGLPELDIFRNPRYKLFQDSIDSRMKTLTRTGLGVNVKQAKPISGNEEEILWSKGLLGEDDPRSRLTINRVISVELWLRVRVNDCQNPEFKILDCQNPEFTILDCQNPEFKLLEVQMKAKILNSGFWQSKIVNSGFWKLNSNSTT